MTNATLEQVKQIKEYAASVRIHKNDPRSEFEQRKHHALGKMGEFIYSNWKNDGSVPDCAIHSRKHYGVDVGRTHIKSVPLEKETQGWLIHKDDLLTWQDNELVAFVVVDYSNNTGSVVYEMTVKEFKSKVELGEPFMKSLKGSHYAVNPLAFYMAKIKRIQ